MMVTSGCVTIIKDDTNLIGISIGGGAPMCPCLYIVQVYIKFIIHISSSWLRQELKVSKCVSVHSSFPSFWLSSSLSTLLIMNSLKLIL